jgi:hypothetical protein
MALFDVDSCVGLVDWLLREASKAKPLEYFVEHGVIGENYGMYEDRMLFGPLHKLLNTLCEAFDGPDRCLLNYRMYLEGKVTYDDPAARDFHQIVLQMVDIPEDADVNGFTWVSTLFGEYINRMEHLRKNELTWETAVLDELTNIRNDSLPVLLGLALNDNLTSGESSAESSSAGGDDTDDDDNDDGYDDTDVFDFCVLASKPQENQKRQAEASSSDEPAMKLARTEVSF